ncbi:uncharacterized protein LOC126914792 [Bombus affinis]|uniref:uncharacterized protein LOC126914787 n=1 Tax=Bombus affinis TaxID=309941 RepID=UPI0021B77977|nr:uncharacterized protein LOC126914787 [Bombus affinis]XP_050575166.1 uncharacterized protein LOC126914791 [Bombus affinis]XP_050575167.1 uncharacterized protein LOC126914792 [Bombus affinis]
MRRQWYSPNVNVANYGEPQIVIEESTSGEEEEEGRRNESPPRCMDPDSTPLNPHLLSPWREVRKRSLPTPQCTSGITASQVRRMSDRGGEESGLLRRVTHPQSIPRGVTANGLRAVLRTFHRPKDPP